MRRTATVVLLIGFVSLFLGCQPSSPDATGSSNDNSAAAPESDDSASLQNGSGFQPNGLIRGKDPVQTVTSFLTALKNGDQATATRMLSVKAQKETAARNMAISPPGSSSAEFTVDPESVMRPGDGTTLVLSSWTDVNANGVEQTYDVGWMMKEENGGLAITGMATRIFEDSEPLRLDFENPDEMVKQRQQAEKEVAQRRQQQQQDIARDPSDAVVR